MLLKTWLCAHFKEIKNIDTIVSGPFVPQHVN